MTPFSCSTQSYKPVTLLIIVNVKCVVNCFFETGFKFSRGTVASSQMLDRCNFRNRMRIEIIQKVFRVYQYPHLIDTTTWIYFVAV